MILKTAVDRGQCYDFQKSNDGGRRGDAVWMC